MNAPTTVARFLALYFFLAGCLQTGWYIYICTQEDKPLAELVSELVSRSWPLAVAAALFVLLDIHKKQGEQGMKQVEEDAEPEIPEAPLKRADDVREEEPVSYFNTGAAPMSFASAPGAQMQPVEQRQNTAPRPAPPSAVQTLFATPPPFQQAAAGSTVPLTPAGSTVPLTPAGSGNATVPIYGAGMPAPQSQTMPPIPQAPPVAENAEQQGGLSFFKL